MGCRRLCLEPRILGAPPVSGRGLGAGSLAPLPAGVCLAAGTLAVRFYGEKAGFASLDETAVHQVQHPIRLPGKPLVVGDQQKGLARGPVEFPQ
jgi:hypothetical protein